MPSSYTSSIGLEKPGTGEQTGSWGTTVNENMDIIDVSVNGVKTLSLSGTSSTLTTTDGAVSDGHYKVLILGGTPSGTHTITLSPNTAQKLYFVNNTTAQSIIFTQGSGGNATITAGETGIIYANGGGATSAVVNLSNDFGMSSPRITGGAIIGATINNSIIGGTTPAAGTFAGLTATGTVNLTGATVSNGGTVTTVDINGGTVDGVVIGGASAAAATVTTLTASGAATLQSTAQITGAVGIGGAANASAQLDVASTTKGLLVPRMTTTQRNAIGTPAAGLVIYNTTTSRYNINNGAWVELPLIGAGGAQAQDATLDNLAALSLVAGDVIYATGADTFVRLAKGTALQQFRMNSGATAPEWATIAPTQLALTSTASGGPYAIDIPAGVRKVEVFFDKISLDSTGNWFVQVGPSSGVVTTGYESTSGHRGSGVGPTTNGFIMYVAAASRQLTGRMTLNLMDSATNLWVQDHTLGETTGDLSVSGGGRIALAGGLERFRLTFTAGNNPDNGQFRIQYE